MNQLFLDDQSFMFWLSQVLVGLKKSVKRRPPALFVDYIASRSLKNSCSKSDLPWQYVVRNKQLC